jgi:hypothetical protein
MVRAENGVGIVDGILVSDIKRSSSISKRVF